MSPLFPYYISTNFSAAPMSAACFLLISPKLPRRSAIRRKRVKSVGNPRRIYFNSVKDLRNVFVEAARKKKRNQEFVFTKPDGNPVPKWYMERLFKKACSEACVGPYRFQDLRHTFNTNMIKAGVDQVVIMKLTGHKTNKMFLRYSHLDKELGETAMGRLNKFLSKTNETGRANKNHPKKEEQAR